MARHRRDRSWWYLAGRVPGAILRRIDGLLWRAADERKLRLERLHERDEAVFAHLRTDLADPRVDEHMRTCNTWRQQEYVHRVKGDLLLDPDTGFVLTGGLRFLRPSLAYDYQAHRPSTWKVLCTRLGLRKAIVRDRVISLRDVNEHNYFHFFNDVLTKVPLFGAAGVLDAPLVIGRHLQDKPFYRAVVPALRAAGLEVIEQGDRPVRAREVVYGKSMPFTKGHLDQVLDLIGAPAPATGPGRSVFIGRSRASTGERLLADQQEVEAMLRERGFEVHDTGRMPLAEQMALMHGVERLVVVHGAGATNMIFRRGAPLQVLELFPAESVPPHYYWLATAFGYGYQGLVCGPCDKHNAFSVPLDALAAAIPSRPA